jgi:hypothetical protein
MKNKIDENPDLFKVVGKENDLKELLVEYVGDKIKPENNEVTVEMVIEVMSVDFPEILLVIAEENFVRGYQQAIFDVDNLDPKEATSIIKNK